MKRLSSLALALLLAASPAAIAAPADRPLPKISGLTCTPDEKIYNVQEVIDVIAGNPNLQMYAYLPSLQRRNLSRNKKLNSVFEIGVHEIGQVIFTTSGTSAEHQRVVFF